MSELTWTESAGVSEERSAEELERFADTIETPDGLLEATRARSRRRRRARRIVIGGAALLTAAGIAVGLAAGQPGGGALSQAANDGDVLNATTTLPGTEPASSGIITWQYRDEVDEQHETDGQVTRSYYHSLTGLTLTETSVSFPARQYTRTSLKLTASEVPGIMSTPQDDQSIFGPSCASGKTPSALTFTSWPSYLRALVSCGAFRYAGTSDSSGQREIELASVVDYGGSEVIWVNAGTYLPVRAVLKPAQPTEGGFGNGPVPEIQTDFRWLAPTPSALAHVQVTIPPGFKEAGKS
jgi:hypothetical protein